MKTFLPLLAALTLTASACAAPTSHSSASSAISQSTAEVTLISPNAKAQVGAHRVEITGGEVKVDGVSYGTAPAGARVRYALTNGQAVLSVDGQERAPARP